MDLRAIGKTIDIIDHLNAPAGIVINAAPQMRGDREVPVMRKARQVLSRYNLPVAPFAITERSALQYPMPDGRAYIEQYPDGRPAREIARLWRWARGHMSRDEEAEVTAAAAAGPPPQRAAAGGGRGA